MMSYKDEYNHWPFLTDEEFELACAFLDSRYTKAKLGPVRKTFKLRLRRTATTGAASIEILRLLNITNDDGDLSELIDKLWTCSAEEHSATEMEVDMPNEDQDNVSMLLGLLEHLRIDLIMGIGTDHCNRRYSAHLWIHLRNIACTLINHMSYTRYICILHTESQHSGSLSMIFQWVNQHLILMRSFVTSYPTSTKPNYAQLGSRAESPQQLVSGSSFHLIHATDKRSQPHPVTDLPAFFIHPCQTKEAMEPFDCGVRDYLIVWLGLVGSCVGLWVPRELAET